jgi:hypothetical protein
MFFTGLVWSFVGRSGKPSGSVFGTLKTTFTNIIQRRLFSTMEDVQIPCGSVEDVGRAPGRFAHLSRKTLERVDPSLEKRKPSSLIKIYVFQRVAWELCTCFRSISTET